MPLTQHFNFQLVLLKCGNLFFDCEYGMPYHGIDRKLSIFTVPEKPK